MIAKRIDRKQSSSNYKVLAHYILDHKKSGHKVRDAWSTNCRTPEDFDLAIKEVIATQAMNTRSRIDKSYHLVISLAPGEDLTSDQWKEVEEAFCQAIGLSEHQRISAIHADTGHVHFHMAISKVHPEKFTSIEPYYDKFKLQETCRQLEKAYGLKPGIGSEKKISVPLQEAHQGLEAFSTYIKDTIAPDLSKLLVEQGKTWKDAQDLCGRFGVEIRERGAGLVFSHMGRKLFVKAGSIDPGFTKSKITVLLGPFEKSRFISSPEKVYRATPLGRDHRASLLYDEYKKIREREWAEFQEKSENLSHDRAQKLLEIKERYARRRQEIKRDTLIAKGRKREIYRKVSEEMKRELAGLFGDPSTARPGASAGMKSKSWHEFVLDRARAGDEDALGILRSKLPPTTEFGEGAFVGKSRNNVIVSGVLKDVHPDGSIVFKVSEGSFVDRGDAVVLKDRSEAALKAAFLVARAKFGEDFVIKGPAEFVQKVGPMIVKTSSKDFEREGQSKGKGLTL
ncbi:MAG TPA: TraI/MobA(P) family conjugative relaxase [Oligoflexus sp.]|uniref:TraI/MobA(P) family conjugative relaxase n=1 Tax=Oligoflexus sp. TaxID=1971216 RepID=UPI002D30BCD3|nr:TraI/MobA(P) family conjugative relaxase [Oligoflexus sp.]HYX35159.1 TraI/MobA(P) family conjugative relaxase [Oligoflexus sp.]